MAKFSIPIPQLVEEAKDKMDDFVRKTTIDVFSRVIDRSPVGNPDLWKANEGAATNRATYNARVAEINDAVLSNSASYSPKSGAVRAGLLKREKSGKALRKMFPNITGKGYVGGRFKGNWQVQTSDVGPVQNPPALDTIDASGNATKAKMIAAVNATHAGGVVAMVNSLPYAQRLENGWSSKQAPAGMVRVTIAEFIGALKIKL